MRVPFQFVYPVYSIGLNVIQFSHNLSRYSAINNTIFYYVRERL